MSDTAALLNDQQRLAALQETHLLDTPPEEAFDRLTRLASKTIHAPVSTLTLIDRDRQFYKSCVGLPEPLATERETPLSYSFCRHTVALRHPLIITDTRRDPRVADNPAIRAHSALAYAGVPLFSPDGQAIGSLCVIDTVPREWTADEIAILTDLAAAAMTEISLRSMAERSLVLATAADFERRQKIALLDSAGEGIYALDLDGRCTLLNKAASRMLGYTIQEVTESGLGMHALIHHTHADGSPYWEDDCPMGHSLRQGLGVRLDNEVLWRRDGTSFPAEYSGEPITIDGKIVGAVVTFVDITARKEDEAENKDLLRQAQQDRQRLDDTVNTLPGAVWEAWGPPDAGAQQITYISKHVEQMLGYSVAEWLNTPNFWLSIVHPEDRKEAGQEARQKYLAGEVGCSTFRWLTKDGGSIWVESHSRAILDAEGRPVGMRGVTMDISDRKRAEDDLRVAQRAIAATSTGVAISDVAKPDMPLIYVNPSFETMTGYSSADAVGKNCRFLQGPETEEAAVEEIRAALREERGCRVTLKNYRKDGALFWNDLTISPVWDATGKLTHYVGVQTDVTARTVAEEALMEARDAAEVANSAKSQFLANMSHELRTPLNAVILYSELLQEEAEDAGVAAFIPDLAKIRAAGQQLLALINDVLDLSKIEAGKMEVYRESCDISTLVREVVTTILPLVQKKNNTLTVECAPDVGLITTDVTKVRQVLFNLLSNAAKFTKDGAISLVVNRRATQEGPEWITLRVTDSGIGMTEAQMAKLFQPFSQGDASTTRTYGGTGLGLTITRTFCEMLGGSIALESQPGKGSTFSVLLPTTEEEAPREPVSVPPAEVTEAELRRTVLVIDDDPNVRDVLTRFLSKEGFRVQTARDGEEGLVLARQIHPMAITLDVLMPRLDGWAVMRALKADADLASIPVIMLTLVDDKNLGYTLGVAEYLPKPIQRDRLTALLKRYAAIPSGRPLLVVDDDRVTRSITRAMLEAEGYTIAEADNGRDALSYLTTQRPEAILLDLIMPEMDGFAFAAEVRAHPAWRTIPIIVMTAKDLTLEDQKRLSGSVQAILQKGSASRDELLAEVRDLLGSYTHPPVQ